MTGILVDLFFSFSLSHRTLSVLHNNITVLIFPVKGKLKLRKKCLRAKIYSNLHWQSLGPLHDYRDNTPVSNSFSCAYIYICWFVYFYYYSLQHRNQTFIYTTHTLRARSYRLVRREGRGALLKFHWPSQWSFHQFIVQIYPRRKQIKLIKQHLSEVYCVHIRYTFLARVCILEGIT